MKKVWKGAAAVVAALSLGVTGFVGASSAYATVTEKGTVTFNNFVQGDEFTAYRILNIESEATGEDGNKTYVYSVNADNKAAVIAGLNAVAAGTAANDIKDADLIKKVVETLKTSANVETFAKEFMKTATAAGDPIKTNTGEVQQGYYLFDMTKTGENAGEADKRTKSKYMVDTVGSAGATFTLKNGTVTLEKKVKDNAGDPGNVDANADWNDSADYAVDDIVPFKLTGTLPDTYDAYDTYYYEFVDTLSAGLTFQNDIKVKTNGKDITSCFDITKGLTSIKAENLKACAVTDANLGAGSEIVVTYTAKVNGSAEIGTAGNPNTAKLVFSNNPYDQGEGKTGTTPDDTVKVFTYDFKGTKTFSITPNDNDLPKFTLTKQGDTTFSREMEVTKQADGSYKFSTERIDAGTYTLTETYTPAGFNTAAPITFTISAAHDVTSPNPTVTISVTSDDKVTDKDGAEQDAAIATATGAASTINNTGGNKLPETGGMGTVVLYTVGGLIVLIAGVGLAVALRRRQA
ncbi:MAG: isopeptide-forming domain-containing fimbrial protein [Bifidobacterium animalis]|nr:isopeptide-forming domain-containing fimbrial protein [Bifidobacterium animalis]